MNHLSSEDILAVHEELASLVRSGLPLDSHLKMLAKDFPGKLRPQIEELARHMANGESVEQALTASGLAGNSAYAAVFAAALRSRQPAKALQSVIATEQRAMNFQQSLGIDFIYPLLVLFIGTSLISFSLVKPLPRTMQYSEVFGVESSLNNGILQAMRLGSTWLMIGQVITMVSFIGLIALVWRANFSALRQHFAWQPFRRLREYTAQGLLCDTLAMLIENEIPLPEAVRLTANSLAGDPLHPVMITMSERLARGERALGAMPPISPYVMFVLENFPGAAMAVELRREAERVRREADRLRRWYATYLPMIATLVFGLSMISILALIHWGPVIQLYQHLAGAKFG